MPLSIRSTEFESRGTIPDRFSREAGDHSPPLAWTDPPPGTQSFALIMDDPDAPDPRAPKRTFVHWVVYNLPSDATALPEDATRHGLPPGAHEGENDWEEPSYAGPRPPIGRHRYVFHLYALDRKLPDLGEPTKPQLIRAMQGHVLEEAVLIASYERPHA